MARIPCNKERPIDRPYEIWQTPDGSWTWKVLKKWQKDDDKPFARWLCAVSSPMTYGMDDIGDVYVADIKTYAYLVETDYDEEVV